MNIDRKDINDFQSQCIALSNWIRRCKHPSVNRFYERDIANLRNKFKKKVPSFIIKSEIASLYAQLLNKKYENKIQGDQALK